MARERVLFNNVLYLCYRHLGATQHQQALLFISNRQTTCRKSSPLTDSDGA